jgi:phosphopantetheine--protein transferase-like protein
MIRIYIDAGGNSRGEARERLLCSCLKDYLQVSGIGLDSADSLAVSADAWAAGAHGKPYFTAPELAHVHWSLSHSGRFTAIAFSDSEVGIDIEDTARRREDDERYRAIARRFFAPDEIECVCGAAAASVKQRFLRIWTAKEAFVKFTGEGLSRGLATFSTLSGSPAAGVYVTTVRETPEAVCAVCGQGREYGIIDV